MFSVAGMTHPLIEDNCRLAVGMGLFDECIDIDIALKAAERICQTVRKCRIVMNL